MLFSADFARLTLVAESFLLFLQVCLVFITVPQTFASVRCPPWTQLSSSFPWPSHIPPIQPLSWQQPYVPVLSRSMLDFLMVPTALLMGCHVRHFEEVAAVSERACKKTKSVPRWTL